MSVKEAMMIRATKKGIIPSKCSSGCCWNYMGYFNKPGEATKNTRGGFFSFFDIRSIPRGRPDCPVSTLSLFCTVVRAINGLTGCCNFPSDLKSLIAIIANPFYDKSRFMGSKTETMPIVVAFNRAKLRTRPLTRIHFSASLTFKLHSFIIHYNTSTCNVL